MSTPQSYDSVSVAVAEPTPKVVEATPAAEPECTD